MAKLLSVAICMAALWATASVASMAFVPAPAAGQLRGAAPEVGVAQTAALSAILAAPEAAHAANQGYAVLQLGWAVFIISLGPAVLFWIYFNKPELL